ncbi:MAG: hypothetical protein KGS60_14130 [Verrucomicrobia bacterium]|nr:hypothetical protein [Verrucomicrobiota bacterium]
MNRTVQAAIVFALALVTLGISIWGRILGHRAEATIRERKEFALNVDRFQAMQTQRLALTHRLKRLYGRQAQLQAEQAAAAEIARITDEITSGEQRLRALNAEMAQAEARIQPGTSRKEP